MITQAETLILKLDELQAAIAANTPDMPSLLQMIHRNLMQDPEQVTLLTSEQVAVIVNGLKKQTQTEIVTAVVSGGKGKALKNISIDDI